MGFHKITQSGTLNIQTLGLKIGDKVVVTCIGGGGGGGAASSTSSYANLNAGYNCPGYGAAGGGIGSSGTYSCYGECGHRGEMVSAVVELTQEDIPVTIGYGGNTAGASDSRGGNGGSTSFGSYVTAAGGLGGHHKISSLNTSTTSRDWIYSLYESQHCPVGYVSPGVLAPINNIPSNMYVNGQGVVFIQW